MPSTVNVNNLTLVHQTSTGIAVATAPDVCLTPSVGSPVPIPYPNIAMSSDLLLGTLTVQGQSSMAATQSSKFIKSTGDEPGVVGGVVSHTFIMEASFLSFSPTVMMDGQPACRLTDKMLMNMGNTVCMCGVLQNPLVSTPTKPPEEPEICILKDLKAECSHAESRKFKLDTKKNVWMGVVADKNSDKVKFSYDSACGKTKMSPGCARLELVHPDGAREDIKGNQVELPLPKTAQILDRSWSSIFKNVILPGNVASERYRVHGYVCNGKGGRPETLSSEVAVIDVYPNVGWDGQVQLAFKISQKDKLNSKGQKFASAELDKEKPIKFEVGGKIKATYGKTEIEFAPSTEQKLGTYEQSDSATQGLFWSTQKFLNIFARFFESLSSAGVKISLDAFEIAMGGSMALKEAEKSGLVKPVGTIWFGAETILSVKIEADLLNWIIMAFGAGALGACLVRIKKSMEEGKELGRMAKGNVKIQILLSLDVKIGGKIGWKGTADEGWEIDAEKSAIEAHGGAKLTALVQGEIRIWKVISASAGASIGLTGADGVTSCGLTGKISANPPSPHGPKHLPIGGAIEFTGLAIYYVLFVEVSVGGEEVEEANEGAKEAEGAAPDKNVMKTFTKHLRRKDQKQGSLGTLIEPGRWPKEGKELGAVAE